MRRDAPQHGAVLLAAVPSCHVGTALHVGASRGGACGAASSNGLRCVSAANDGQRSRTGLKRFEGAARLVPPSRPPVHPRERGGTLGNGGGSLQAQAAGRAGQAVAMGKRGRCASRVKRSSTSPRGPRRSRSAIGFMRSRERRDWIDVDFSARVIRAALWTSGGARGGPSTAFTWPAAMEQRGSPLDWSSAQRALSASEGPRPSRPRSMAAHS